MKTYTNGRRPQKTAKGFTLIEITLVIALLLGLVAVLFIGIAAYKKGSDKAKCVLIQSTMQKAIRSYQNLNDIANGVAVAKASVVGSGAYAADPGLTCPGGSTFAFDANTPAEGTAWVTCPSADGHVPSGGTAGW